MQRGLFAGGIAMLAYCGFVVTDAWVFQNRERSHLERMLADRRHANVSFTQTAPPDSPKTPPPPPVTGGLIGRIEIARLGISVIVMEGTSSAVLRRAAGHISGTALPGQPGNIGISAHRDTFFRPLRNIRQNDVITLATLAGEYRYRVVSTRILGPADVSVLDPSGTEILTLVTCYPFYFVGSAPNRFIVRAEKII